MESKQYNTYEKGFALLMALIVVGVVLSVGLTILDVSIKQVKLSTNAKESEVAFHAANAGMECSRYWRRASSSEMENGQDINPSCFDNAAVSVSPTTLVGGEVSGDGAAYIYDYEFTWGTGFDARCTRIRTLVASSTVNGAGFAINNMTNADRFPGYPDATTKTCAAGERCTVVSVQGFSRPCATAGGYGTVQREVLLQF